MAAVKARGLLMTERANTPLVHVISNYVTINDVVNSILAVGAAAIAADDPQESADITALSEALLINSGTPNDRRCEAMLRSGVEANRRGIPVVLDPVGAGASPYRRTVLTKLLETVRFTCIRGNRSELAELCGFHGISRGVEDSGAAATDEALFQLAGKTGAVLCLSGATTSIIAPDGSKAETAGGSVLQKKVTGSGCMMGAVIAAGLAKAGQAGQPDLTAKPDRTGQPDSHAFFETILSAVNCYEEAARRAEKRLLNEPRAGTASYRQYLIDALSEESLRDIRRDLCVNIK